MRSRRNIETGAARADQAPARGGHASRAGSHLAFGLALPRLGPSRLNALLACVLLNVICAVTMTARATGAELVALPAYNAAIGESSISGISSGAFMAVQFGTAWSSIIKGVGVVAGGPFYCAQADASDIVNGYTLPLLTATGPCMKGPPPPLRVYSDMAEEGGGRRHRPDQQSEPAKNLSLPRLQRSDGRQIGDRRGGGILRPLSRHCRPRQSLLPSRGGGRPRLDRAGFSRDGPERLPGHPKSVY
jgi:hypothetical protein